MVTSESRPNVIFVLTDDQGYGDLSCLGNPILRTPNLDRLYADSIRLTDFHVAPMCTPTRGELMTGCDAMKNGATFVCMGRTLLRSDLPTMADILGDNGYRTGHFGKWHLGDNYPYRPQDRGFQETIHHPGFGITSAPDYYGNDYFDDWYRHKDEIEQYRGYCTDVWFQEAIKWMQECHAKQEPFFAYIALNAPHGPLWVPNQYREPYTGGIQRDEASFFGMIANIDENMAKLESFLHQNEILDNTILIFMTDNGTATGENIYNAGMRGKKRSLYEGGHRVPCFIRWPEAGLSGGRDVGGVTRSTDILPTLIDWCQLRVPDGWDCDGLSLANHIRRFQQSVSDRVSVIQYGHATEGVEGYTTEGNSSVLWKQWRLVNGDELYDTHDDPGQMNNLFESSKEIAKKLRYEYDSWWDSVRRNLTQYQPITIGSNEENPTRLCSNDWAWVYADNQDNIRGCVMDSGTWHVNVDREGLYDLTLRRWPEESGLGISDPAPVMQGVDGSLQEGKALPVSSAWVQAGDGTQSASVLPDSTFQRFQMKLDAGPRTIKSWWMDEEGNYLAGAYYLTAERLGG